MALFCWHSSLAQSTPALPVQFWPYAFRHLSAATLIYVAVLAWWRRLGRGGGGAPRMFGVELGHFHSTRMRAQGPTGMILSKDVKRAASFPANLLGSAVTLPSLRTLSDALLHKGAYRTRKCCKRHHTVRLVQPSTVYLAGACNILAHRVRTALTAHTGHFPRGLTLQDQRAVLL